MKMPPQARHRLLMRYQPLTFSPFGRKLAHVASGSMTARRRMRDSDLLKKSSANSTGNGVVKNTLKVENERSESSDDEEFDEEESDQEEESSEEEDFDGTIQTDFVFSDPKPDYFHGVKNLLQTYLDDKQWDLSGFANLISEQTTVGTVVKVEDDEDNGIFGLVTALNLGRYKDDKCIMEVKDFLLKACQNKDAVDELRSLCGKEAASVGLLVSQRVTNLPLPLLPHLYDALFDEITWATEDEPKQLRKYFHFKFYIIVSKIYKKKSRHQKKGASSSDEAIIYIKPEDEIFHTLSSWSFEFSLHTPQLANVELKNYLQTGIVMAVKADKIPTFRQQLKSLLEGS